MTGFPTLSAAKNIAFDLRPIYQISHAELSFVDILISYASSLHWLVGCISYVPLENIAHTNRRHHYHQGAENVGLMSREESLQCYTCCDTRLRFLWSHSKDSKSHIGAVYYKQGVMRVYAICNLDLFGYSAWGVAIYLTGNFRQSKILGLFPQKTREAPICDIHFIR